MSMVDETKREARNTRLLSLVRLLFERTKEHKIDWEFTAAADMFQASFPVYIVQIRQVRHKEARSYLLEVLNDNGNILEDISDASLQRLLEQEESRDPGMAALERLLSSGSAEEPEGETAAYRILEEIYVNARRIALGSEQAVDDLIRLLGEEE